MISSTTQHLASFNAYKNRIDQALEGQISIEGLGLMVKKSISEKNKLFCDINSFNILQQDAFPSGKSCYKDYLYHIALNEIDRQLFLEYTVGELLKIQHKPKINEPCIFCAFHFGGYMHLVTALQTIGYDVSIMSWMDNAQDTVKLNADDANLQLKKQMIQDTIIDIKDLKGILKIFQAVRRGKSIVALLDFSDSNPDDKRTATVSLGKYSLSVPRHIFDITEKLKIPIVPVFATRHNNMEVHVRFHDPIYISKGKDKDNAIQYMFDLLQSYLKTEAHQWIEFSTINTRVKEVLKTLEKPEQNMLWRKVRKLLRIRSRTTSHFTFNAERFGLYKEQDSFFIVDIQNLLTSKVSSLVYTMLENLKGDIFTKEESIEMLGQSLFNDLFYKKILKPVTPCTPSIIQA